MPKFARFNPNANPSPVYEWIDNDAGSFPRMTSPEYLLILTDAQWVARNAQSWQVSNGQLEAVPSVSLAQTKQSKLAELAAACQGEIFTGFDSSAMGAVHHYPAKDRDQSNLAGSVLASILPGLPTNWTTPFWCADAVGNWAFVPHTAAQIQQVGIDAKAAIVVALEKNSSLAAQVMICTTVECVIAITW